VKLHIFLRFCFIAEEVNKDGPPRNHLQLGLVLGDSSWGSTWLRGRGNNRSYCDSSLGKEGKKKAEQICEDAGEPFVLAKEIPYKDKSEMTHPDSGKD
jgi:hypothetical protein